MSSPFSHFKNQGFLLAMAAVTALAWLYPGPGAPGGWLHPEMANRAGIALIFFLHGVTLSFAALKAGTMRWQLHLLVQTGTFLVFPLLGLALNAALGPAVSPELKTGIFYLCALPSTVSSSVALTAAAGGNVAAALFNATLSSVIGVVLTPLWVAMVMHSTGQTLPLAPVIADLARWLVLPLVLGQLSRPLLASWAGRNRRLLALADRATILLLVYTSFCGSFKDGVWASTGPGALAIVLGVSLLLFAAMMGFMNRASRIFGFPREDRIAAMFCGSKKTLASGLPMAKLMFGTNPALGMILLPIMIYHPMQLIICGALADRWGRSSNRRPGPGAPT